MTASETRGAQSGLRRLPVALQLYSVREQLQGDFQGTVRAVGEMGYDGVQFAGYGGLDVEAMRACWRRATSSRPGRTPGWTCWRGAWTRSWSTTWPSATAGSSAPLCRRARRRDLAGWREVAASLNRIGERCARGGCASATTTTPSSSRPSRTAGCAPRYRRPAGGDRSAAGLLGAGRLLDHQGWRRPGGMIREYAGRVPITHLKDMTGDARETFAEVGGGDAALAGHPGGPQTGAAVEWHCVEQDRCDRPPLESVRLSLEHLRSWGMGLRSSRAPILPEQRTLRNLAAPQGHL